MSQLGLIIKNEYKTDISAKSFWIATFIVPLIFIAFSIFGGYMMSESETSMRLQESILGGPDNSNVSGLQIVGMLMGMFLTLFIMMYGSQIFNKVKTEKTNRIVEILATCVPGRTMMMAKIISVGLLGMTQLLLWGLMIGVVIVGVFMVFPIDFPWEHLVVPKYIMAVVWSVIYFLGGYLFYGALFAAVGAMTDKNNENQEYVAVLTLLLLASFYIAQYAVDHGSATFVLACCFIPFTSPTIGAVNTITHSIPWWQSIISVISLYLFAAGAVALSGKIYTSSILLKGKKLTPSDIITFFRSK
ncbi:MAG: ABC transporter permease [Muribaculaceae bacterium]|nr:ABC transporter permease [Muribaculaceae bacterium]